MNKNFLDIDRSLFNYLGISILIFLIVLIVFVSVDISNKLKEGKYIGQNIEAKNTITVSGKGEIYSKPNLALVDFSVKTEAKIVSKAINENSSKMNKIIEAMGKEGIDKKDLKTTSFNIYPRYEYIKSKETQQLYPYGKRVLAGYDVSQTLEVKIRNMGIIGEVVQKATDSGANEIGNMRFTIENEDELKSKARKEAIDKAKSKAKELASQLGVNLVRIVSFSENANRPDYYRMKNTINSAGAGETTPQIETGENKTEVNVNIVYEIN